ncbi:hypothetical protein NQ317_000296 [Molorchus minor]|uniref:Carbohydrate kinase PfkB domain-containing protein n=1 Tax=Molorchus minor TaxID=1323400 RepID=A0ABQ9JB06_9CUCU|nr:hypothetical protein NQ317_000296 [Molorchus minor]
MVCNEIVVIGSCMIDFVSYAPRLPKAGETIRREKFITNYGGKGANQCVASAKLGGKATLIARVGDDSWGNKLHRCCHRGNKNMSWSMLRKVCEGIPAFTNDLCWLVNDYVNIFLDLNIKWGTQLFTDYDPQLLGLPTIFCVNESEAGVFTGLPVNNKSDAKKAAVELLLRGCKSVLITLGSQVHFISTAMIKNL